MDNTLSREAIERELLEIHQERASSGSPPSPKRDEYLVSREAELRLLLEGIRT